MKKLGLAIAIIFCALTSLTALGINRDSSKVYVEKLPKFKGGTAAFGRYISSELQYPELARIIGVNGRTVVSFVVDTEGNVVEVAPLSCVGAGCEAEAVRIISNSPKWTPGMQDGKAVRVSYTVPINFSANKTSFKLSELQKSAHNYILLIDGIEYSLEDCAAKGFNKFQCEWVAGSYLHPDQKRFAGIKPETYVIELKDECKDVLFK